MTAWLKRQMEQRAAAAYGLPATGAVRAGTQCGPAGPHAAAPGGGKPLLRALFTPSLRTASTSLSGPTAQTSCRSTRKGLLGLQLERGSTIRDSVLGLLMQWLNDEGCRAFYIKDKTAHH
ncbi:hypothetical protein NDU88_004653 [Pleurodeles waltl]|uniref:Uncharacterized protein n=1 Tax=Pleurodeles waltl TaxID=8319 RepID=A0AAV7VJB4_PLEWA|nr:hypothetical protein NDU88_004653 [Pleurodeles waltl]